MTIENKDAIQFLKEQPNCSADIIFTDPPYALGSELAIFNFCLECDTRFKKNVKQCPKCKIVFPNTSEFFYNRSQRGDLSCYCKKCNTVVKVEQNRKVKVQAVEYLGGKCILCGYSKHTFGFDFHQPRRFK